MANSPLQGSFSSINTGLAQRIYVNVSPVGTGADTTEDTLMSFTLPGGTLANAGSAVRITAFGTGVTTADTMTLRLYFGNTKIVEALMIASQIQTWRIVGEVYRSDATHQVGIAEYNLSPFSGDAVIFNSSGSPTETMSSDILIKVTGQRASSSVANSIRELGLLIELIP